MMDCLLLSFVDQCNIIPQSQPTRYHCTLTPICTQFVLVMSRHRPRMAQLGPFRECPILRTVTSSLVPLFEVKISHGEHGLYNTCTIQNHLHMYIHTTTVLNHLEHSIYVSVEVLKRLQRRSVYSYVVLIRHHVCMQIMYNLHNSTCTSTLFVQKRVY